MLLFTFFFVDAVHPPTTHRAAQSGLSRQITILQTVKSERMNLSLMLSLIVQLTAVALVGASAGDKSPYYMNCINGCLKQTCQNSEYNVKVNLTSSFLVTDWGDLIGSQIVIEVSQSP